jgi:hypothetical protein
VVSSEKRFYTRWPFISRNFLLQICCWFILPELILQPVGCNAGTVVCWEYWGMHTEFLVGNLEGKRPLKRFRRMWEDNIIMDLTEIGWEGVDWLHLAQGRDQWCVVMNTVMNLWVPWNAGNILTSWVTVSFSRMTFLHLSSIKGEEFPDFLTDNVWRRTLLLEVSLAFVHERLFASSLWYRILRVLAHVYRRTWTCTDP